MNAKERKLLSILHQHAAKILTFVEAAEEADLSERRFYRIKARFPIEGVADPGIERRLFPAEAVRHPSSLAR